MEAYFVALVRHRLGGEAIKLKPPPAGLPDRLVVLPDGVHCFVELKTLKGRDQAVQPIIQEVLRRLGHKVFRLAGKQQIDEWVLMAERGVWKHGQ